jgi:hypothetical protein
VETTATLSEDTAPHHGQHSSSCHRGIEIHRLAAARRGMHGGRHDFAAVTQRRDAGLDGAGEDVAPELAMERRAAFDDLAKMGFVPHGDPTLIAKVVDRLLSFETGLAIIAVVGLYGLILWIFEIAVREWARPASRQSGVSPRKISGTQEQSIGLEAGSRNAARASVAPFSSLAN